MSAPAEPTAATGPTTSEPLAGAPEVVESLTADLSGRLLSAGAEQPGAAARAKAAAAALRSLLAAAGTERSPAHILDHTNDGNRPSLTFR